PPTSVHPGGRAPLPVIVAARTQSPAGQDGKESDGPDDRQRQFSHLTGRIQHVSLSRMTVLDWLLDADPAIRWQVLRDLVHAPAEDVAAERARVATEGWGARLLALQGEDGQWAGGACFPARSFNWRAENQGQPWTATLPTLQLLHDFGVDPRDERVQSAVASVRAGCCWEHAGQPFFSGEVEPCINGRVVTLGV